MKNTSTSIVGFDSTKRTATEIKSGLRQYTNQLMKAKLNWPHQSIRNEIELVVSIYKEIDCVLNKVLELNTLDLNTRDRLLIGEAMDGINDCLPGFSLDFNPDSGAERETFIGTLKSSRLFLIKANRKLLVELVRLSGINAELSESAEFKDADGILDQFLQSLNTFCDAYWYLDEKGIEPIRDELEEAKKKTDKCCLDLADSNNKLQRYLRRISA